MTIVYTLSTWIPHSEIPCQCQNVLSFQQWCNMAKKTYWALLRKGLDTPEVQWPRIGHTLGVSLRPSTTSTLALQEFVKKGQSTVCTAFGKLQEQDSNHWYMGRTSLSQNKMPLESFIVIPVIGILSSVAISFRFPFQASLSELKSSSKKGSSCGQEGCASVELYQTRFNGARPLPSPTCLLC